MIITCNLHVVMKSPTVFCLAEVSLFCFDRSVLTLHRRASIPPPSPPSDFLLSISVFLVILLIIKYDIHSNSQSEGSGKRHNRNFPHLYRPITSWGRQQRKQRCLDSKFYTQSAFYTHSAVCSLHFILTNSGRSVKATTTHAADPVWCLD